MNDILTIKELLMSNGYPTAYIQGHHTRIVMDDTGNYRVLRREHPDNPRAVYIMSIYEGDSESLAVQSFIESENV